MIYLYTIKTPDMCEYSLSLKKAIERMYDVIGYSSRYQNYLADYRSTGTKFYPGAVDNIKNNFVKDVRSDFKNDQWCCYIPDVLDESIKDLASDYWIEKHTLI